MSESQDGVGDRLGRLIDQRVEEKLKSIGIYMATDESIKITRRDIQWMHDECEKEEARGQGRRKTISGIVIQVLGTLISAAVGGALAWFATGRHP